MPSSRFSATDLLQLERQLKTWRRLRRGHRRLPEELWEAAVALGRTHGLSRVARALCLDYHKLQRLSDDQARVAVGPFVENSERADPSFTPPPRRPPDLA